MRIPVLAAAAVATLFCVDVAHADMMHFKAAMNGASEVPPVSTSATGNVDATLDTKTKMLSWTADYSGLSGPANGAHFHGPAAPGATAGMVAPFPSPLKSPVKGSATLTDAQMEDVEAGKWYANIHTAAHPGGEIRGQLLPAK